MMMAHDSGQTPTGRLDDATVGALRTALRGYLASSTAAEPLRVALVAISAEAREKGILPEQVLVVLKDVWNGMPEVRGMADATEQIRALQRVVTMCIKEYYSA